MITKLVGWVERSDIHAAASPSFMNRKTPDGYRRLNPSCVLVAGPLSEVAEIIRSRRAELREQHGWIMDS
jgi:hypothetical protein